MGLGGHDQGDETDAGRRGPANVEGRGARARGRLSFWIYAAVWLCYLKVYGTKPSWLTLPWYPTKCRPSFADALAALRRALWRERISANSSSQPLSPKIATGLIEILARAA